MEPVYQQPPQYQERLIIPQLSELMLQLFSFLKEVPAVQEVPQISRLYLEVVKYVKVVEKYLDSENSDRNLIINRLRYFAKVLRMPPVYLCIVLVAIMLRVLRRSYKSIKTIGHHLILVAYPLKNSLDYLQAGDNRKGDVLSKQLISYWILYALDRALVSRLRIITDYIPFFNSMKLVFFIYSQNSQSYGAFQIYKEYLQPIYMALRSRGLNAFVADSLHLRAEDSDGSDNDDFGSPYDRRSSNISSVNILSSGVTKDSFEGFHGGSSQSQKFVDSSKQSGSKQRYVNAKQKINVSENVAALLGLDDYYNSISSIPRRRRSFNDINGQNELVADSAAAGNKIQYDGFYKISSNEMLPIPTTD